MEYCYIFLIGLLVGGTLGTIMMGLLAAGKCNNDANISDNTVKDYVMRK